MDPLGVTREDCLDGLIKERHGFPRPLRANELWLTDITEHKTSQGELYLCAVKDVFPDRIVGYSIDSRMKARVAVDALTMAGNHRDNPTRIT